MAEFDAPVIEALTPPPSWARVREPSAPPLRIGVVQHAWTDDAEALRGWLDAAVDTAADRGARIVFLPEVTLSRYPADTLPSGDAGAAAEDLDAGPTLAFARAAARRAGVYVHASLYRQADEGDGLGLNTAVIVSPAGTLVAATNKLHIPVTAGYYEDKYFRPGPAGPGDPYPVYPLEELGDARLGLPTCWDEWFPEVARAYGLGGANIVVYPTAIGSEPDHPDFDTQPLWQQVIVGNGIVNGLFMVVPNRTGRETKPDGTPGNTFYGSSFVSDPYGRVLAQAPRDEPAVLVVDLDLDAARRLARPVPVPGHPAPGHVRGARRTGRPPAPVRPRRMSWTMPHEGDRQERLWLAWPTKGYTLGDTAEDAAVARHTWAAVANAAANYEPVTVVAAPTHVDVARHHLSKSVEIRAREIDDAWIRDSGPSFVKDESGALGAVTWTFNGWGQQQWATWAHDAKLGPAVAEWAGARRVDSDLVNEGGGIHVDGLGTVLVTETVQRDPGRNPGLSRAEIEAELARTIGATTVVWLPRGLTRDSDTFGTRGHVDIVATISSPGRILLHDQRDDAHPDKAVTAEIRAALADAVDARGERFEIVDLPAPSTLTDAGGFVDYSYVNHVVINGAVIACSFDDPHDGDAVAILRDEYPGREIVTVDARPLFERGGGIHCITQQQPSAG